MALHEKQPRPHGHQHCAEQAVLPAHRLRTAQQAADALGVALGQIAKSIIFRRKSDDAAVLVVTSGDRRVDEKKVDALVGNHFDVSTLAGRKPCFSMALRAGDFVHLHNPAVRCKARDFAGRPVHAIAGIGDPQRFFDTLSGLGLSFEAHPFPDHHDYAAAEIDFGPDAVLLMTEKDAVKCARLVTGDAWFLPVEAIVPPALIDLIVEKIRGRPIA